MAPSATGTQLVTPFFEPQSRQAPLRTNFEKPKRPEKSALQAISQGVPLPGIPIFNSIEKQRHFMLEHMAGAFRVFARKGYTEGMSGHISVRDPENSQAFWTNPYVITGRYLYHPRSGQHTVDYQLTYNTRLGRHFGLLKASDMILVDESGNAIGGNTSRPVNAAGFQIHSAIHKARPDVNAACHTHSPYGKAWSAFAQPLEMLNQDACLYYGKAQAVYSDFGGVVFDKEEGERLAAALGLEGKVLTLRNHGLLTLGGTVDEAAFLFTSMERSCEVQLMVDAATASGREKVLVSDEMAEYTFRMTSDPETLYCEFQPDYEYELETSGGSFLV